MRIPRISLWSLLVTVIVTASQAQQGVGIPDANGGPQCGGQYECVEDRPLSAIEAATSVAHPARRASAGKEAGTHRNTHSEAAALARNAPGGPSEASTRR